MKAVVYNEYAPDDNFAKILKVQDIAEPKPKADEVIFTNKASALNYNARSDSSFINKSKVAPKFPNNNVTPERVQHCVCHITWEFPLPSSWLSFST